MTENVGTVKPGYYSYYSDASLDRLGFRFTALVVGEIYYLDGYYCSTPN